MEHIRTAIILAAGKGNRMHPVTMNTPKPLVKVHGIPMIETGIQALVKNGIEQIYIVVGYLKEEFQWLEEKYPMVTLLENPYYEKSNTISSLYVAKRYLNQPVIITYADHVVRNPKIFYPEIPCSQFCCTVNKGGTQEWILTVDERGMVNSCSLGGDFAGWQMAYVSLLAEKDARKIQGYLEEEWERKKNYQIYWEEILLYLYPEKFQIGIREIQPGDITEIDTIEELAAMDSAYDKYCSISGE